MLWLVRINRKNYGAIPVGGPGYFLIAGMHAPDRSGGVLLGLARPLSYRPREVGGALWMSGPGTGSDKQPSSISMQPGFRFCREFFSGAPVPVPGSSQASAGA